MTFATVQHAQTVIPMSNDNDPLDFDDETLRVLTPYERRVRREILDWRSTDASRVQKILDALSTPAEWTLKRLSTAAARDTVTEALRGGLEMVQDGSRRTFRVRSVLANARSHGVSAETVADLRTADLERLDELARTHERPNKWLAAVEGGTCGLGGVGATLADLPLLFGIALRAVQQIGTCYGFDVEDPDVRPVALSVFNVGAGASSSAKAALLADVHVAAEAFARKWTYEKVARRTTTGAAAQALKRMTRRLPQKIARKVTKQKLVQTLPLVGAAIGAGFNYAFLSTTARAARMTFRSLFLTRRYGPASGSVPVPA